MVIQLYTEILQCFLKKDYVFKTELNKINPKNGEHQLTNSQLYLGINVLKHKDRPEIVNDQPRLRDFYGKLFFFFIYYNFFKIQSAYFRCRQFLQSATVEIKKRYNMNDPVLSKLSILKPNNAVSLSFRDETPSLIQLMTAVPRIIPEENGQLMQSIDTQWRRLPFTLVGLKKEINIKHADFFWYFFFIKLLCYLLKK